MNIIIGMNPGWFHDGKNGSRMVLGWLQDGSRIISGWLGRFQDGSYLAKINYPKILDCIKDLTDWSRFRICTCFCMQKFHLGLNR